MTPEEKFKKQVKVIYHQLMLLFGLFGIVIFGMLYYMIKPNTSSTPESYVSIPSSDDDVIENGIHVATGLIDAEGLTTVINNCTNCHSSKLIIQNRMNTARWNSTIKWMQDTQNLWDLGEDQTTIVNYLVTNYPPPEASRRETLTDIEWYELID